METAALGVPFCRQRRSDLTRLCGGPSRRELRRCGGPSGVRRAQSRKQREGFRTSQRLHAKAERGIET
ncbi:type VII secretion protein EccCa [Sesbania bispinosa]|nr:type VII secretion protein EccCa [Sesbania bispinosa]